jgi:hypothetical protein
MSFNISISVSLITGTIVPCLRKKKKGPEGLFLGLTRGESIPDAMVSEHCRSADTRFLLSSGVYRLEGLTLCSGPAAAGAVFIACIQEIAIRCFIIPGRKITGSGVEGSFVFIKTP